MTDSTVVQGFKVDRADPDLLRRALDEAFHYRGDVTITLRNGGKMIDGYLFDRKEGVDLASSCVRVIPNDSNERLTISYDQIDAVEFSGKDAAAGKTWENWLKRYVEKRLKGEAASIESESLD